MKIETIVTELRFLKGSIGSSICLKNYCELKKISYTSTSRILKKGVLKMTLRTAYNILGLTPERNIPQVILCLKIDDLLDIKQTFENKLI